MSFVSLEFLALLLVSLAAYHSVGPRARLFVLLAASYVFYAWWDWRFLPLLAGLSVINYLSGLWLDASDRPRVRRLVLWTALVASFAALVFFKYAGLLIGSAGQLAALFGAPVEPPTFDVVLPLGVSFITFQGVAYVVDVYRREHQAERDLWRFLTFKAFFPQLVAGPIERAGNLLDQLVRPRPVTLESMRQALWLTIHGYFLKVVVADSLAPVVDTLFVENQWSGWSVVLGTLAFGLQIYADFNGYSTIAKGLALFFGIELIWNFRYPYWATSISEFWRLWHISLSSWLRDYLYIPLGGSRSTTGRTTANLVTTMALGGLWHGASWTFLLWGLLHGVALATWRLLGMSSRPATAVGRAAGWTLTMAIVFTGWFLFRASTYPVLLGMLAALGNWETAPVHGATVQMLVALAVVVGAVEWWHRRRGDFAVLGLNRWLGGAIMGLMVFTTMAMLRQERPTFIYFQF